MKKVKHTHLNSLLISLIFLLFGYLVLPKTVLGCTSDDECYYRDQFNTCCNNDTAVCNYDHFGICCDFDQCALELVGSCSRWGSTEVAHVDNCAYGCSNGACNPAPSSPTCDYNRSYNQCCNTGLSQSIDEYTWSNGSGVCNYGVGPCNQSDLACGGTYCGDNSCNSGENCSTCPTDCGACITPPPGSTPTPPPGGGTPPPGGCADCTDRVVGTVYKNGVHINNNHYSIVTNSSGKYLYWFDNSGEDWVMDGVSFNGSNGNSYFEIGRWAHDSQPNILLTNPDDGYTCTWTYNDYPLDPTHPWIQGNIGNADPTKAGLHTGQGCSAPVYIVNKSNADGGYSNNWQNHLKFNLIPIPNSDPKGNFDGASCISFSGWACDMDAQNTPITVHFYRDGPYGGGGTIIGSATAGNYRGDLVNNIYACNDAGYHGFSFTTPSALYDGINHTIYAYAINTPSGNNPMPTGSPKTINCTTSCSSVNLLNAYGAYGLISGITPITNQINWAYSNVLTGPVSGYTCSATVTGCGATINRDCYITTDPSTTNYRARVDFTPTTNNTCAVTFTLSPGADTCNGTSSTACGPVNGICNNGTWGCSGGNRTRNNSYTAPTCGGSDVTCTSTETIICDDNNTCTTNSCSAGNCVYTNVPVNGVWSDFTWGNCFPACGGGTQTGTRTCIGNSCGGTCAGSSTGTQLCPNPSPCPPWLKTTGGDVHANQ